MGEVWQATDLRLDRTVAVKFLVRDGTRQDMATLEQRFEREARLTARIDHPGVPAVYDHGRVDDDRLFLVMEFVEGRTLAEVMREQGPLGVPAVAGVAWQAADILAHAHRLEVVHRDLKPSNLMLTPAGTVSVLDFGVATALGADPDAAPLTATNAVVGTAAFMSPEQALGKPALPQSDVYALGCVLFALLTGRAPFEADMPVRLMYLHAYEPPPRLEDCCPGVPAALADLVAAVLAKDPGDRPGSAEVVRVCRDLVGDSDTPRTPLAVLGSGPGALAVDRNAARVAEPAPAPPPPPAGDAVGQARAHLAAGALDQAADALRAARRPMADPATLPVRLELCRAWQREGRFTRAHEGYAALEAALAATRPETDPDLLASRIGVAECLAGLGRSGEAVRVFEALLPGQIRALGADAPNVLRTRLRAAVQAAAAGRVAAARDALVALDAEQSRVLPADHEQVLEARLLIARLDRMLGG
jgi:hypothetical protein